MLLLKPRVEPSAHRVSRGEKMSKAQKDKTANGKEEKLL